MLTCRVCNFLYPKELFLSKIFKLIQPAVILVIFILFVLVTVLPGIFKSSCPTVLAFIATVCVNILQHLKNQLLLKINIEK